MAYLTSVRERIAVDRCELLDRALDAVAVILKLPRRFTAAAFDLAPDKLIDAGAVAALHHPHAARVATTRLKQRRIVGDPFNVRPTPSDRPGVAVLARTIRI